MTTLLLAGLLPAGVHAVGLDDIRVDSALNQPLDATIPLSAVRAAELDTIDVRLASAETFERMGLDRPFVLNQLRFTVDTDARGIPRIHITTADDVREPFLNFLIEVRWPRGRVVREYTILLDPPVLMPAPSEPVAAPATPQRRPDPAARAAPQREPEPSQPMAGRMRAGPGTWGPIQRGDTLWGIAESTRPEGVTNEQMMLAILEANPDAFYGNINYMLAGHVLRIPGSEDILSRDAASARREVQRQNEAWRTGEPTDMRIAEAGPAARDDELRLYAPGEPRDDVDEPAALPGELSEARERIASLEAELEAEHTGREMLTDRLVELEAELAELRRQVEIRDAELAALRAGEEPPVPEEAVEPATTPEPEPEPEAEPEAEPEPEPVTADEPDLMDRIMGLVTNPLVLALVLGIPVLVALGVMALRRRRTAEQAREELGESGEEEADSDSPTVFNVEQDDASGDMTARGAAGAEPAPEAAPSTPEPAPAPASKPAPAPAPAVVDMGEEEEAADTGEVLQLDESDPRNEADFHLAYGLYDEAAELMDKAVVQHPDRTEFRVKLLEVYFAWGKPDEYVKIAREGKDALVAAGEWGTIAIMGRQMKEDEPLFSADEAGAETTSGVDLDLEAGSGGVDMEFDIGADDASEDVEAAAPEPAPGPAADDLDLGDFEYPESEPEDAKSEAEVAPAEEAASDDLDAGLDFDMDTDAEPEPEAAPGPAPADTDAEPAQDAGDDDMSMDFDMDMGAEAEAEPEAAPEPEPGADEAASGEDEGLEFDMGELETAGDAGDDDSGGDIDLESALSELEGEDSSDSIEAQLAGGDSEGDADLDSMLVDEGGDGSGQEDDDDAVGSIDSQLDLARAFIDMGDADGARGILDEVLETGDEKQQRDARELLDMISSS